MIFCSTHKQFLRFCLLALALSLTVSCATQMEHAKPVAVNEQDVSEPPTQIFSKPKVIPAPSPVTSLLERAQDYLEQDQIELAEREALRAQRLSPQEPLSYYILAQIRAVQARLSEAKQLALRARSLVQDNLGLKNDINQFLESW